MIRTVHLTKNFDGLLAVNDLSLEIARGEIFAFLGPNGAGKTTTIKLLTGLLRPTIGRVLIGGQDIQHDHIAAKRIIGYIPDRPYLYEKLTGWEFLHFIGDLYEIPHQDQQQRAEELLDLFSLTDTADRLIEDYSHGMRQKLVMAASFLHHPEVIIIDEPMVGLDPRSARIVKNVLRKQVHQGKTVFLSTHTLSVAEELAHRIGIIQQGRLRFLGNMSDLRERQRSDGDLEDLFLKLTEDEDTGSEGEA